MRQNRPDRQHGVCLETESETNGFDIVTNNSTTNALQPLSANGSSFFAELRLLLGGIECERLGGSCSYGRIVEALQRGIPAPKRVEEAGTGFGIKTALPADLLKLAKGGVLESESLPKQDAAFPGQNQIKIYHRALMGLLSQHLYLPLWALTGNGASFEFLLQANGADAVVGTNTALVSGSTDWTITQVKLHMDILHVDEALMSSYTSHLLKVFLLGVPFRSYTAISFQHSGSSTAMLQIPRNFSRCSQIWVLPSKPSTNLALEDCNYFPGLNSQKTRESWIQIGSTKFPSTTYGVGAAEHLYRYQKALGYTTSGFHVFSNTKSAYEEDSLIIIFDLERVPQQAMSGMSTHGGNLTVRMNGLGTSTDTALNIEIGTMFWPKFRTGQFRCRTECTKKWTPPS